MKTKYLIIGAGPAGLGAAYRLQELGEHDFVVVEQAPWVGGLATSFVDSQGFTWDIGGHVQFSHYPYFDKVMDEALGPDGWLHHERESWVWIHGRFVPYPFQNNIRYLPPEAAWRCLKGIIDITSRVTELTSYPVERPKNFREWILSIFGEGIASEFMLPYNAKVWAYPAEEMDYGWIGERVSVVDLNRVAENLVLGRDDVSWGPNNLFRFPEKGGTGAIWNSVANMVGRDRIQLERTVCEIDTKKKVATCADGSKVSYTHLLSTIPVDIFSRMVTTLPDQLKHSAQTLKYSSSHIVGIGVRGQPSEELKSKCWMYFPEDDCPFYRVTLFSNYSPNNVPDIKTQFSLMAETSESPVKPVNPMTIVEETIEGMKNTKLIRAEDKVVSTWYYKAPHGYPTPSLERDKVLNNVIPALDKLGVYSRGRFGGWKYEVSNQDHTFMQGVEWTNFIVKGEEETTFKVNT